MPARILVCDPIAEDGIALLKRLGAEVDVRPGLSPDDLRAAVDGYDALIVRSETRLTREVIEAAGKLQVIGRAGIGGGATDTSRAPTPRSRPAGGSASVSWGWRCGARRWASSGSGRWGRR